MVKPAKELCGIYPPCGTYKNNCAREKGHEGFHDLKVNHKNLCWQNEKDYKPKFKGRMRVNAGKCIFVFVFCVFTVIAIAYWGAAFACFLSLWGTKPIQAALVLPWAVIITGLLAILRLQYKEFERIGW